MTTEPLTGSIDPEGLTMQNDEQQRQLFQFVIALVVLVGGGLLMAFFPPLADKIFPVMTLAAGFYFSQAASKSGAATALQTLTVTANSVNPANGLTAQAWTGAPKNTQVSSTEETDPRNP